MEGSGGWRSETPPTCILLLASLRTDSNHIKCANIIANPDRFQNLSSIDLPSLLPSLPPSLQGSEGIHHYHAVDVQAPRGTGDLTIKIPKGTR